MKKVILIILAFCFIENLNAQKNASSNGSSYVIKKLKEIENRNAEKENFNLIQELDRQAYKIKSDSIFLSFKVEGEKELKTLKRLNSSSASFHQVLRGKKYYCGFIQVDSLLNFESSYADNSIKFKLVQKDLENDDQGPTNINSDSYETGFISNPTAGTGISIAIVDSGWEAYLLTAIEGYAPSTYTYYDCSSGICILGSLNTAGVTTGCTGGSISCGSHGTMVSQIVYDHAPAADYYIFNADDNDSRAAAIQKAADLNLNIISCSQSSYNAGWNDDEGVICEAVNDVGAEDILMFFSAGNRHNGGHWQGSFVDVDNDDKHEWDVGEERNFASIPAGASFSNRIQWDSNADDYDVIIVDNIGGQKEICDDDDKGYEVCNYVNPNDTTTQYAIEIISKTGNQPDFETWYRRSSSSNSSLNKYTYFSSDNQTSSPGNCVANSNLFIVAAVDHENYAEEDPTIKLYSSNGPTNDLVVNLGLTGPTDNTVADFDTLNNFVTDTFGGTSCATPNCAGAAAALWAKYPTWTTDYLRDFIIRNAELHKDWGASGRDNEYGYGGMYLPSYDIDNIFIDQDEGINNIAPANGIWPWYSILDYENLGTVGKKAVLLTDDEETVITTLEKAMIISSSYTNFIK